jgi:hypothetical protein
MQKDIKISVRQYVPIKRVYDMLVDALEGGSNYWYMIQKEIEPPLPYNFTDSIWNEDRKRDCNFIHTCEIPFNVGGALLIDDERADEPTLAKPVHLNLRRIKRGLAIMAKNHTSHYANWLNEEDDADTADVFLQCCIFGDVIYG